jgi:hypothetical protein
MKNFSNLFLIFIFLQSSGCSQNTINSDDQSVFIVVIDGVRYPESFGSKAKYIPHLYNNLKPLGTLFTNFRIADEGMTSTNPGQASILTGNWQLIANNGTEHPNKPTLFEYYRKAFDAKETDCFIVAGKKKLDALAFSSFPDYGKDFKASTKCFDLNNNNKVYDSLIVALDNYHPKLVLVNFPMTDKEAHSGSWDGYIAALENADSLIYLLYNKIQSDSFYKDNTTLLITNDHGRHTDNFTNHGCDCDGCEHIMLLAIGKDFEENKVNDDLNYQIDICKTVGYIMKFKTPFAKGNNLITK